MVSRFSPTDSQLAVKPLTDVYNTSNLIHECRTFLNDMTHSNIADKLAENGAKLSTCKNKIDIMLYMKAQQKWNNQQTCLHTNIIFLH